MKRSWIGAGLLAVLLICSLLADWGAVRCHSPVSRDLETAGKSALAGDWQLTSRLTGDARDHWERYRPFSAAIGNQSAMEQVDSLFARLEICLDAEDRRETAALCAEIARRVADLSPSGNWWDML